MIEAILYYSKCGHTYAYAETLSKKLNIPLYTIRQAKKNLPKNSHILFMSWVKENRIMKYEQMIRYSIEGVVAVGILPVTEERLSTIRTENQISQPLFYLPGGIQKKRLGWIQRIQLKTIESDLSFKLLDHGLKQEEIIALDAILHNLNYLDLNQLEPVIQFFQPSTKEYIS